MAADGAVAPPRPALERLLRAVVVVGSLGALLLLAALCANHVAFPLHLDLMEGTVLQHAERFAKGEAVYPSPSPDFVPLAYNVGYVVVAAPLLWLGVPGLVALRLVSIAATALAIALLVAALRGRTRSLVFALAGAGLFAAAYRTMDAYLDSAHSDACMVAAALAGTYVLDRARTRRGELLGVALLVASFWFKQHGAWFALGGLVHLVARRGVKASLPSVALAVALGPLLYVVGGNALFGPSFHSFTWSVPSHWTKVDAETFTRPLAFVARHWPLLLLASLVLLAPRAAPMRRSLGIWATQLLAAAATAAMGSLDPWSSDNVYVGFGAFLIVGGTLALHEWTRTSAASTSGPSASPSSWRPTVALAALLLSFVPHRFDPRRDWIDRGAAASQYADLLALLRGLDGPVYAPTLGHLDDFALRPQAHWVALDDLVRGPDGDPPDSPLVRKLLAPALAPKGSAYVLSHFRLEETPWLQLAPRYELAEDLGDRFCALAPLRKRFFHGWPRYLYRSKPDASR